MTNRDTGLDSDRGKTSDEIEREVERTRARVTETLEELRERMSPTHIVDQMVGLAKDTGADDMILSAGRVVKNNPLPFLVIGAGLAWLAASAMRGEDHAARLEEKRARRKARRVAPPEYGTGVGEYGSTVDYGDPLERKRSFRSRVEDEVEDASERVSGHVRDLGARARSAKNAAMASASGALHDAETAGHGAAGFAKSTMHKIGDTAAAIYDTTGDFVESAVHSVTGAAGAAGETIGAAVHDALGAAKGYGRAASDYAHDHGRAAGDRFHSVGDKAMSYGRETAGAALHRSRETLGAVVDYQPVLVVGALGFAIGAAIGAALPSTAAENRLMGDTADEVKSRARRMADEQLRHARDAAGRVYDEVKEDMENQDFAAVPGEMLSSVTDRVRHVAETARTAARDEATEMAGSAEEALNKSSAALTSGMKAAADRAAQTTAQVADKVVRTAEAGSATMQDIARGVEKASAETKASTPSSANVQPKDKVS